jgi:hypothetical protein
MEWKNWLSHYEFKTRWQNAPRLHEEALRALWAQERDAGPLVNENDRLAVATRPHRLLLPGDILLLSSNNGMFERYPAFGVSSKGARLCHYWLPFRSSNEGHGSVDLIELPGDFINMRWNDPAIGRFVVNLRASCRSRVGASSPASWSCRS